MRSNEPRRGAGVHVRRAAALSVALLAVIAICGTAYAAGNGASFVACAKGGWMSAQADNGDALSFANQRECVQFAVEGGLVFSPSLIANPTHVPEETDSTITGSGFHPDSAASLKTQVLGGQGGSVTLPAVTNEKGGTSFFTAFPAGACAAGVTGVELTFTDAAGVHASTTVLLDCP